MRAVGLLSFPDLKDKIICKTCNVSLVIKALELLSFKVIYMILDIWINLDNSKKFLDHKNQERANKK